MSGMNFSQRIGKESPTPPLQVEGMDQLLRTSLWNIILAQYTGHRSNQWREVSDAVAVYFRRYPKDELPHRDIERRDWLKKYYYALEWNKVYDLVEFLVQNARKIYDYSDEPELIAERYNAVLRREHAGYRFIACILTPVSNTAEMDEISRAIERSRSVGLVGAEAHLTQAVAMLGRRPNPDARNSIKEAISAVESTAKILGDKGSGGLSAALGELTKHVRIHRGLVAGFNSLYGYTSDENGIRHAILEDGEPGLAEARYMTISCSAFVHYLIEKAAEAGIQIREQA